MRILLQCQCFMFIFSFFFLLITFSSNASERKLLRGIVNSDQISGVSNGYQGYNQFINIQFCLNIWKDASDGKIIRRKINIVTSEYGDPVEIARIHKLLTTGTIIEIFVDSITDTGEDFIAYTDSTEVRFVEDLELQKIYKESFAKNSVFFHKQLGPFIRVPKTQKYVRTLNLDRGVDGFYYGTVFELHPRNEQEMVNMSNEAFSIRNGFWNWLSRLSYKESVKLTV